MVRLRRHIVLPALRRGHVQDLARKSLCRTYLVKDVDEHTIFDLDEEEEQEEEEEQQEEEEQPSEQNRPPAGDAC